MFGWVSKFLSRSTPFCGERTLSDAALSPRQVRIVRAKYDAAQTTDDNTRHWVNSDNLSANAANSASVRRTLRNRARYEVANSSYAKGIVLTLANDAIGTGPRLQMLLRDTPELNTDIETRWSEWADRVGLAAKLRTMRMAEVTDGEAFALFGNTSAEDDEVTVTLDLKLIEADQVSSPLLNIFDANAIDGIRIDTFGNPTEYDVLKYHPGDSAFGWTDEVNTYPAYKVIHLFRADRPGQYRGVPELTPALELFAQLRRYTEAVIAAAETAADFAAVIYSDMPSSNDVDVVAPLDTIEIEKRMMTTMPYGYKVEQLRAEQPSSTYGEFKNHILNEIARCLNMPFNVAACNSSSYNYASGRLDHQVYFKSILVERRYLEVACLSRIFILWYAEARRVYGWPDVPIQHEWHWDGYEHVDPESEANALMTRLSIGMATHPGEWARDGKDWEGQMNQGAKALGIPLADYQALVRLKLFGQPPSAPAESTPAASATRNGNGKSRNGTEAVSRR